MRCAFRSTWDIDKYVDRHVKPRRAALRDHPQRGVGLTDSPPLGGERSFAPTRPSQALDAARATLEEHSDQVNAAHARYLEVRRLLLIGQFDEAERRLAELDPTPFPPALTAAHELVVAGIAMRRLRTETARAALARAERAARHVGIPTLTAEEIIAADWPALVTRNSWPSALHYSRPARQSLSRSL
jgi:hypothetical protein